MTPAPLGNGTVRSRGQWGTMSTSRASAVVCRRVRNFPHSSCTLRFSQTPSDTFLLNFSQEQPPVCLSVGRLVHAGFCFCSISRSVWAHWTLSGGFPARFVQEWLDPPPPPFITAWGMRGLSERKSRNSHVWMNKRIESDGIAAEMEENTLPAATCKSCLPFELSMSCFLKKCRNALSFMSICHIVTSVLKRCLASVNFTI